MKHINKKIIAFLIIIYSSSALAAGPITHYFLRVIDAPKDALVRNVPFVQYSSINQISQEEFGCLPEFIDDYYLNRGLFVNSVIGYDQAKPSEAWVTFKGGYLADSSKVTPLSEKCKNIQSAIDAKKAKILQSNVNDNATTAKTAKPPEVSVAPVVIKKFNFVNNKYISSDKLATLPIVSQSIGQLGSAENLDNIIKSVSDFYKSQDFILTQVRVTDTEGGNIVVSIYEGTVSKYTIENKSGISDEAISGYIRHNLCDNNTTDCKGVPIKTNTLERSIGILSDTPGIVGASTTMSPGADIGSADVKFSVNKAPTISGYVSADNYGAKVTGKNRATLGILGNNLAGIGDQLITEFTLTDESKNAIGQLGYSIPLGYDGWRIGTLLSRTQSVFGGESKELGYKVVSDSLSLWGSYPIIRSQSNNLTFRGALTGSKSKTTLSGTTTKSDGKGISLGLNGRIIDNFIGRSYTAYGATANISEIKDKDTDKSGNYTVINYNASRDQHLANIGKASKISLYLSARGQQPSGKSHKTLTSCIGGVGGVRAYIGTEGCNQKTAIGTVELRFSTFLEPVLPAFVTFGIFHDNGTSDTAETTGGTSKKKLSGNGISVNMSILDQFALRAEYAEKTNSSPLPTSDDTRKGKEFWLSATYNF